MAIERDVIAARLPLFGSSEPAERLQEKSSAVLLCGRAVAPAARSQRASN